MKLSRVEIYGFKSFPQRTEIRFGGGITGIVGPNGSGKSNIADAVRWVMGEQSARALRGAKMEDVIFSGTQKRRLMPYCEVSLIFDNEDRSLKDPHSEVMVTRRAYRTGEGEYYLNQKSCRLRDIVDLFNDTGIGREGYSIIGQGHIDVILSGRGEERRAAFEEAAGIIGYRSRKEEAERKLERTVENLSRAGDLLEELGGRLGPLKEQSEAAREYLALSGRLKMLDTNIFLARRQKLGKRIEALTENNKAIAGLIAGYDAQIARCQGDRRDAEEALKQADCGNDRAKEELQIRESRLSEHLIHLERAGQALKNAQDEAQRNGETLVSIRNEAAVLREMLENSSRGGHESGSLLARADEQLRVLEQEAARAQAARDEREEALETHRARMLSILNSRSSMREQRARQQVMLAQAQARYQEVGESLNEAETAVQRAEKHQEEALLSLKNAIAGHQVLREELKALEEALEEARNQSNRARDEYSKAFSALQQGKARLMTMKEMSGANEGYQQSVRQALLYAKGNPHVHGAVARLIQVPEELETAVEMVLGSALQHIVTQDEETAKELIDFLREKRFGRATFLPVTAVSPRTLSPREREALSLPGCLGVASERVTFAPEHQNLVQSLLGRTVIARDLDSAIAISRAGRQAYNVVTLQGDVMRSGGAMTGGSAANRTVSLLGREREIKDLAESLDAAAQQLDTLNAREKDAGERASLLEKRTREAMERVQDDEIGIAREEEQVKKADEQLEKARRDLSRTQAAKDQLAGMVSELESDLAQAEQDHLEADSDREKLEEEDETLRGAFTSARDMAEAAQEKLAAQREARSQLAHEMDLINRDKTRFERELLALKGKEEKLEHAISGNGMKIIAQQAQLKDMEKEAAALETLSAQSREEARQAEMARRDLAARQKALMDEAEAAHLCRSEDSQKLHISEMGITRLEDELKAMAAQLWNSHELSFAMAQELRFPDVFSLPAGEREAEEIRGRIREMGAINIHALEDYTATKARYDDLNAQKEDAEKAREDLGSLIKRLQGQMERQFIRELAKLNEFFAETFRRLFSGGQASLSLSDPSRPLDCDIQIKAQPPGKKLQLLSLLSGGERALTAIAILFAMLRLKPTPFCILDEIEAALDDANITSFAEFLSEYARDTQFIVITHRKGTMERCDTLYGVAMREKGVSDMISVNLKEYTA